MRAGRTFPIYIHGGRAQRVPRKLHIPSDIGIKVIELDIDTKAFTLDTDARQIALSGPKDANIYGIDAESWGSLEYPAIYMDRDCRLVLIGRAVSSAVIRVNPLARVTIDARKFETPEIKIMGNSRANVLSKTGTTISYYEDTAPQRVVVTSGWYGGTSSMPPTLPGGVPAPTPPGMVPPAPADPGIASGAPAIPGAQTGE
jgi:hypothetical protein